MIGPRSMVVLKGHHLFPMVVADMRNFGGPPLPGENLRDRKPTHACCMWLGTNGQPFEAVYPLEILAEVDG